MGLFYQSRVLQIFLGVVIGVLMSFSAHMWFFNDNIRRQTSNPGPVLDVRKTLKPEVVRVGKDEHSHRGDDSIATLVHNNVRVLCWIMVRPNTVHLKAIHVKNTWGKRCDKLLFFEEVANESFPTIGLGIEDTEETLATKAMASLKYIYKHHFHDGDWFLKADDDTFVIMENLKYFLLGQNTREPVYFGEFFNPYQSKWIRYNSGGAGYVLSKEALWRVGTTGSSYDPCSNVYGPEDEAIGFCLQTLNVTIGNTTDIRGRSRFHFDRAEIQIEGITKNWYKQYVANPYRKGIEWLSNYPITFHYVHPHDMLSHEYYFYRLKPYGIFLGFPDLNQEWK